jgi:hypothetical protein
MIWMGSIWTAQSLEAARLVGDPIADPVIKQLFESGGTGVVNDLMRKLVDNDGLPPEKLPPIVRDYVESTADVRGLESEQVALGEQLFARLGPEMLTVLGFYGLPMDYAAGKGVRVLYRTAYLSKRPIRRVLETTQMVVDVMAPGGLGPSGRGVRAAQKVRLMHAAVRHLIQNDSSSPWNTVELGVPINQEDLAGTLMTFGYIVLAGLERLGFEVSAVEREAYFQCWMEIGRIMGVRADLIPANVDEGRTLAQQIFRAQGQSSSEGKELASALVKGYQQLLPEALHGMPASMMHFFLQPESLTGRNVAEMLGLPPPDWTLGVTRFAAGVDEFLAKHGIGNPLASELAGMVGRELIRGFLFVERANRAPFSIPLELQQQWETRWSDPR